MSKTASKLIVALALALAAFGCKKSKSESQAAAEPGAAAKTAAPNAGAKTADPATLASKKTNIPECDEYFAAMDTFVTCDKLQPEMKTGYREQARKQRDEYAGLAEDKRGPVAEDCKKAMADLKAGADARGCKL